MSEPIKQFLDGVSVSTAFGVMAGWLPTIAALFAAIYTGLRIYEWIERRVTGVRVVDRREV